MLFRSAKVKVVLKRYGKNSSKEYSDGRLLVDFDAMQVFINNEPVKLTQLEFKLLSYLIQNENRVISKQELFENVWEDKFTGDGTLNVHIRKIREAVERDPGSPEYIITVWGGGYKFSGGRQLKTVYLYPAWYFYLLHKLPCWLFLPCKR